MHSTSQPQLQGALHRTRLQDILAEQLLAALA